MQYGIPSTVLLADINADTLTDIVFAVDIGGQVWRFDLDNSGSDTVITGGVVAKLAGMPYCISASARLAPEVVPPAHQRRAPVVASTM